MKITVFAKKKSTKGENPKEFYIYITTLTNKKTGETFPARVKFRNAAGLPDPNKCPRNIEFDKATANLVKERYTTEEGETRETATLWLSSWKDAGAYVDHSLDDFD